MSDETTLEAIVRAVNAINAQHPQGTAAPPVNKWVNETDGNGRRVLRLEPELLTAISYGLGIASQSLHEPAQRPPSSSDAQIAWAAIIEGALRVRLGDVRLATTALRAIERVDVATLERMATLLLGEPRKPPETPEAVAAALRDIPDEVLHAPLTHAERLYPLCDAIQRWKAMQPDTPETVAAKAKAARGALDAFRGLSDREGGQ